MRTLIPGKAILSFGLALVVAGCSQERRLAVKSTAYNSTRAQTDDRPTESACGDKLRPGARVVAVSRDLRDAGLTCGTKIRIEGLRGLWTVSDVTAARHRKLVDIYMGKDIDAAREWGVREVEIRWRDSNGRDQND